MFKKKKIAIGITIALFSSNVLAADGEFNVDALELNVLGGQAIDLEAMLDVSSGMLPGVYNVDLYVNNKYVKTDDIDFVSNSSNGLIPALSKSDLNNFGIDVTSLPSLGELESEEKISEWAKYIPNYLHRFDVEKQRLYISVPQLYVKKRRQGWIDPNSIDNGITALMIDYDLRGDNSFYDDDNTSSHYFGNFRSGFNIGRWRVRNYSTYNYNADTDESEFSDLGTKLFTNVQSINSRFELGNINTRSSIFDSVKLKGTQLFSDDSMLPSSISGFAPVIHGFANSNAKVTVEQDGSIIYKTVVSPGQFAIDDLYPTSLSGDLVVTVEEEDGTERSFIQPFSSVPNMVREGHFKYTLATGVYDGTQAKGNDLIVTEGSAMYGVSNMLTLYSGAQVSKDYNSFALGLGLSLGEFGAVTGDWTHSLAKVNDEGFTQGDSFSVNYSKDIEDIGASINLASYRYSTEDFYTIDEMFEENNQNYFWSLLQDRKREKLQISLNQQLKNGEWGSLSLYGYRQSYWNNENTDTNVTASYSNSFDTLSYTFSYSLMKSELYEDDEQLMLTLSVPLSDLMGSGYFDYSIANDTHKRITQRFGFSDSALPDKNLNYNVVGSHDNQAEESLSANINYLGSKTELSGNISKRKDSTQVSYGMSGSIIAHESDITFSQPVNSAEYNAVVLIDTHDVEDIHVNNGQGITTNDSGYAVVPYVNSYKNNDISIDDYRTQANVEVIESNRTVTPSAGAIVKADFLVKKGFKGLLTILYKGEPIPFGSVVKSQSDKRSGSSIVGNYGVVYLTGMNQNNRYKVNFGNTICEFDYQINESLVDFTNDSALIRDTVVCD
ncbi:fimbria/pilus outer membrane usher protein [Vibrio owensii]|uniref:fimbria/pilus outer membrane usher protein n=1 Tax=Vibrio owensii TaxID=696485 RepID=UPI00221E47E9|nr:fimbria/pilus outer membrane usher protein [Vibrio owensii]